MAVKIMRWSPWPAAISSPAGGTRRFQVKVRLVRLENLFNGDPGEGKKVVAIKMKWKGEPRLGLLPFSSKQRRDHTAERTVGSAEPAVEWGDEFENVCGFSVVSDKNFGPWILDFNLLCGEAPGKLAAVGKVSLNVGELASTREAQVETRLPVNVQVAGIAREAALLVALNFVEIRDGHELVDLTQNSAESFALKGSSSGSESEENDSRTEEKKKQLSMDELSLLNSNESAVLDGEGPSSGSEAQSDPHVRKSGFFSWKRRRLSFKPAWRKGPPSSMASCSPPKEDAIEQSPTQDVSCYPGCWETNKISSRDGRTQLKADIFFASFDQCSEKAAGESACTTLVTVIAYWLQSHRETMPTVSEFDDLIVQGSLEWRKLCENEDYVKEFPNKHFDLETVLHADIRPLSILREKSFIRFFEPEKFESLIGAMSFDEMWKEIGSKSNVEDEARLYVVSWNDHFFVLKADANAYYIIDRLGERLFEGCNQAYILRFDENTRMNWKRESAEIRREMTEEADACDINEKSEHIILTGKECCREFIKRFLAAIPLGELEAKEKKEPVTYFSLHQQLQIEFSLISSLSPASSSSSASSSPFSPSAVFSMSSLV